MKPKEYLEKILEDQTLKKDSREMKDLESCRKNVELLLNKEFPDGKITIRPGGSVAKGTLILENYDLDLTCYFAHDDTSAGETLKDIYAKVKNALLKEYTVQEKRSALRLRGKGGDQEDLDFHIDVVPGRFTDDSKEDVFLYQSDGEKERLKTNPLKHISHIKESGHVDAIRLAKLWRERKALEVKTFVLELLVIKVLEGTNKSADIDKKLRAFWEFLRDKKSQITVEDPANPEGNDLSDLLDDGVKNTLSALAKGTLESIEESGWVSVFGEVERPNEAEKAAVYASAVKTTPRTRPWCG